MHENSCVNACTKTRTETCEMVAEAIGQLNRMVVEMRITMDMSSGLGT